MPKIDGGFTACRHNMVVAMQVSHGGSLFPLFASENVNAKRRM